MNLSTVYCALRKLNARVKEIEDNPGGTESDPIFTTSPSYNISNQNITDWGNAFTNSHTHSNKAVLDGITSGLVTNWNTAFTNNHTHANKTFLDALPAGSGANQYLTYNGTSYSWSTIPTVPTNADYVDRTTAQSVGGVKTFTAIPIFTTGLTPATDLGATIGSSSLKFSSIFVQTINAVGALRLLSSATNGIVFGQTSDATTVGGFIGTTGNFYLQAPGAISASLPDRLTVTGTSLFDGAIRTTGLTKWSSTSGGWQVFNTSDETTNTERAYARWISAVFQFGIEQTGTGLGRTFNFQGGATTWIGNSGQVKLVFGSSGIAGAFRSDFSNGLAGAIFGLNNTITGANLIQQSFTIVPTISQTGTSSYRGILISPFLNTVGSGGTWLIDAGVNTAGSGAGTHTSRFSVLTSGKVFSVDDYETTGTGSGYIVRDSDGSRRRITTVNGVITVSAAL